MEDIRGLFNVFSRFSQIVLRADALKTAEKNLESAMRKECGNCRHWMHYPDCPRERRDNTGISKGPAHNEYACNGFERKHWSFKLIEQREKELAELKEKDIYVLEEVQE